MGKDKDVRKILRLTLNLTWTQNLNSNCWPLILTPDHVVWENIGQQINACTPVRSAKSGGMCCTLKWEGRLQHTNRILHAQVSAIPLTTTGKGNLNTELYVPIYATGFLDGPHAKQLCQVAETVFNDLGQSDVSIIAITIHCHGGILWNDWKEISVFPFSAAWSHQRNWRL